MEKKLIQSNHKITFGKMNERVTFNKKKKTFIYLLE